MPVIVRLTTHVCHAKEKVRFAPWQPVPRDDTPRFDPANGPYIPITSLTFPMKRKARRKLAEFQAWSEATPLNLRVDNGNRRRGILTVGLPWLSLLDALEGIGEKPDLLKLALAHPLPRDLAASFLASHDEVKVLEELDDFLEQELKALAYERGLKTRIIGKQDQEEWIGEHTPERVEAILRACWPDLLPASATRAPVRQPAPPRPAQLCPGCGHRSAFFPIKQALAKAEQRFGGACITVADIGCHTLGFLPPYEVGQVLLCMGHSCGTAAGLSLFNPNRKVVAFLGDSTFFHAGIPGIINARFNTHDFTLIVMENGTTAMTGHQDHPGVGRNFREPVEAIPIRKVLEGLGVTKIWECDTYQQEKLQSMVEEALAAPGFKVVIARHPCMLKFTRQQARAGKPRIAPVRISEKCDLQKSCISRFGCPTYQFTQDGKVRVETDLCIGDGSCRPTCPRGAIEPGKPDKR